jgi:hypothetical protein
MAVLAVRKPNRSQVRLTVAMFGYGGCGKSYSSLLLARGLVGETGRILVIHTEAHAIDMYTGLTDFDVMDIEAPFTTEKFSDAIYYAAKEGYDCAIIDSFSAEWSGKGGLLDMADGSRVKGLAAWKEPKGLHKDLLAVIETSPIDLICTMWAKQNNQQVKIDGKTQIVKEGDKPDSERTTEYKFDVLFYLGPDHRAKVLKDRTQLFSGQPVMLTKAHGEKLSKWRGTAPPVAADPSTLTVFTHKEVITALNLLGVPENKQREYIQKLIGKMDPTDQTTIEKVLGRLNSKLNEET